MAELRDTTAGGARPAGVDFDPWLRLDEPRLTVEQLGNGERRRLKEVALALQKITEGGFGDCERCGEPIADKRLDAVPDARYCIECQRAIEEEERTAAR